MINHLSDVCMDYKTHFCFSMYLSYEFDKASVCAFIHAIAPDLFITFSSDTIKELEKEMKKVGCKKLNVY